jgi:PAS domain-containing protein
MRPIMNSEKPDIEKFRSLVNHIPGVIYRCSGDEHQSFEFFSDELVKLTGYPQEYFMEDKQHGYTRIVHRDDRDRV